MIINIIFCNTYRDKKKTSHCIEIVKRLEVEFKKNSSLNNENKMKLAQELGLSKKQVDNWMLNRRTRGPPKALW